jgi:hypothetical protein
VKWFTALTAIGDYFEQILGERPMRREMSAGPAYAALTLAAAAALLFVLGRNGGLYSETQRRTFADIGTKADAMAVAIAENPSAMVPP